MPLSSPSPLRLFHLPRHLSLTLKVSLASASSRSLSRNRTHTQSYGQELNVTVSGGPCRVGVCRVVQHVSRWVCRWWKRRRQWVCRWVCAWWCNSLLCSRS